MGSTGVATTFAIGAGVAGSVQIAVLGGLGTRIGAIEAAAVAFTVTAIAGTVILLVTGRGLSAYGNALRSPWWMWVGALTGVCIVTAIVFAGPRIGIVATSTLLIAGQLVSAAAIDRFGWFGVDRFALGWARVAGLVLVAVGAVLTLRR